MGNVAGELPATVNGYQIIIHFLLSLLVFINPFFSSGVHLVFTGEIVATVFITSSICGPVANTLRLMSASITIPRLVLHIQGTSYSYLSSFCGLPEHFSDSLSPS